MTHYSKITILVLALTFCLASGCSDRGTNSPVTPRLSEHEKGGILVADHVFFDELLLQINNRFQQFFVRVYLPSEAVIPMHGGPTPKPMPLLVLLAPEGGDHEYYFNRGLKQIADEMIASGAIQPMAIACVPNDKVFGGYFYAGHYPGAGDYDTLIGGTLLEHLYKVVPYLIDDPHKRGIGGVGQGAYGAFRAAIKHPGQFRSISVTDGPLDFDGHNGQSGFVPLFEEALIEQGLLGVSGAFHKFDSTSSLATMLIGGALAFSPRDTSVTDSIHLKPGYIGPDTYDVYITSRQSITDSTTLVDSVVTVGLGHNFDFLMPFDSNGAPYLPIWDMWLANNLENLLTGTQLAGVNLWFGTTRNSPFGFHEQTESWMTTLTSRGIPYETKNYAGYDAAHPPDPEHYLYDILRDMLKHHSDSFGD